MLHVDRAKDFWDELKRRFSHGDSNRISSLHDEIANLKQENFSVTNYYPNYRTSWDQLNTLRPFPMCTCDLKFTCELAIAKCASCFVDIIRKEREQYQVLRFLKGLNDEYASIKSRILVLDPMLDVHRAFGMEIKLQTQLHGLSNHVDFAQANATLSNSTSNELVVVMISFNKNFKEKYNNGKGKSITRFTYCNMISHIVDKCYKKDGFPPRCIPSYMTKFKQQKPQVNQVYGTPSATGRAGNMASNHVFMSSE